MDAAESSLNTEFVTLVGNIVQGGDGGAGGAGVLGGNAGGAGWAFGGGLVTWVSKSTLSSTTFSSNVAQGGNGGTGG